MLFPLGNLMPGKKFLVETEDSDEGESIGESSEILKLLYYLQLFLRIGRGTSGPGTTTNDVQSDGV